jgi:site-specific recombinase XerD
MNELLPAIEAYLRRRYGDRSTPKHYLSDLRGFVCQAGDVPVASVTAQTIDAFVSAAQAQGQRPRTINRRLAALHTFFEFWAMTAPDSAGPNPVVWRRHGVKVGESLPRDLAPAPVTAFFAAISAPRDQALFGLLLHAGLRVGEAVSLRLGDLAPPPTPEGLARLRVCGKGRKERYAWLTPRGYARVQAWLAVRPASASDALFLSHQEQPLSVAGAEYLCRQYSAAAGVAVTCHQLRHTFATQLTEQGVSLEVLAQLLGHTQISTTQIYTRGADLGVQAAFLTAMAQLEAAGPPPPAPEPPLPLAPPAVPETPADREALTASLTHFAHCPAWLRDRLTAYLTHRWGDWQPHLAAEHAQRLARVLRQTWDWLLAHAPLQDWGDLRAAHVAAWLSARQAAGLAVSSQITQLNDLRACLRFVAAQDVTLDAALWRIPYPRRPAPLPRDLSEAAYQRLLQTVLTDPAADVTEHAWFLTLAHTGVRVAELLHLQRADVDLAGGRLVIRGGKGTRDRVVYLTPALTAALRAHLATLPPTTSWVWENAGQRLTAAHVRYRLRQWGAACEVHVTPHRLRHTYATRLLNQGVPLDTIRKLLGHKTLSMTQHYAQLHDATVRQQFQTAMEQLEGIPVNAWPQVIQPEPAVVAIAANSV